MKRFPILFRAAIAACALAAADAALAQDWAKASLDKSPRHGEWVAVRHGTRDVQCFVVYPEVKYKATAILLIHEIYGLSDWARSEADQLAGAGYIVIAPDLLSGAGPNGGGTSAFPGQTEVTKAVSGLPDDQVTADLAAAEDYAIKLPACNGKVVAAGFCWGGGQTFRLATNDHVIKAAFVFYGAQPKKQDDLAKIDCPVYGFYAGNDARITVTIPNTALLMKAAGKAYESVVYEGAGHGFMRAGQAPDANAANKKARDAAWSRCMEILQKI